MHGFQVLKIKIVKNSYQNFYHCLKKINNWLRKQKKMLESIVNNFIVEISFE